MASRGSRWTTPHAPPWNNVPSAVRANETHGSKDSAGPTTTMGRAPMTPSPKDQVLPAGLSRTPPNTPANSASPAWALASGEGASHRDREGAATESGRTDKTSTSPPNTQPTRPSSSSTFSQYWSLPRRSTANVSPRWTLRSVREASLGPVWTATLRVLRQGQSLDVPVKAIAPPDDPPRHEMPLKGNHPLNGAVIANINPAVVTELGLAGGEEKGVVILRMADGSPAARFLSPGEVLLEINGRKIAEVSDVAPALSLSNSSGWSFTVSSQGRVQTIMIR